MEELKDLSIYPIQKDLYEKVPYNFVKKSLALPLEEYEDYVLVAVEQLSQLKSIEDLWFYFQKEIRPVIASSELLKEAIDRCYRRKEGATSELIEGLTAGKRVDSEESYDLLDEENDSSIIRVINAILTEAIQQGASDVHLEPFEDSLHVRYRIDGILQVRHSPPKEFQSQLISRIKVMACLDIAEKRLPQDGRMMLRMGKREVDFRVSTVPVIGGERIVLRILDKSNMSFGLDILGIPPAILKEYRKYITFSEGIILVTGPTGSGKTTTLYGTLKELHDDHSNIMSIEDPVEYNLKGISQIGVRPKINLTFATGLRHILRQDPDIIMIGEIRDVETAEIAVQASLTGHLVFSTLHTNDAPSAITRLVDMGIEPYLITSSLIGVLAQRLVRCLCSFCKEPYDPNEEELKLLSLDKRDSFYRAMGCSQCYGTGYKGRQGVYEFMVLEQTLRRQILKSADAGALRKRALELGMQSLLEHGGQLVLQGVTDSREIIRVARGMQ